MKHIHISSFFITAFLLFSLQASAQLDSCNVFLQGNYIEVGINSNGAYGSSIAAPPGYHPKGPADVGNVCFPAACPHGAGLGFVADPDKDGWTVGTPPYFGDYFLPGQPQEGWSIEADGVQANAWNGGGACGSSAYLFSNPGLTGGNTSYANNVKSVSGVWQGRFNGLDITQETSLDSDNVFFIVHVTLVNTSVTTKRNVYYLRTVDPDNTEPEEGGLGFYTYNYIPYQLPNPQNRTLVAAQGHAYRRAYLGLGTLDCRARCFYLMSGLAPVSEDLGAMYNENDTSGYHYYTHSFIDSTTIVGYNPITGDPVYAKGYDYYYNDVGIGLVFSLDSLQPGDTTELTYAYILREGDVDQAFEATKPKWQHVGDPAAFNSKHDLSVCRNSIVPLTINKGSSYKWTWYASNTTDFKSTVLVDSVMGTPFSADTTVLDSAMGAVTGLDTNKGITINISMGSVPRTIVAIGATPSCVPDTIIMHLIPNITPPPQTTPILYYCKGDPKPKPLSAIGSNLRWMVNKTDSVGTATAPTPKTDSVGAFNYYVRQTVNGCTSDLAVITVIVNAPPPQLAIHNNSPLCLGDTLKLTIDSAQNAAYTWVGPDSFMSKDQNAVKNGVNVADTGFYFANVLVRGCPIQKDSTYVRIDAVIVKISADKNKVCQHDTLELSFAGVAPDTGTTYTWDFSNATVLSGSGKGPYFVKWDTTGAKTILLDVRNWRCKSGDTDLITVSKAPDVAFNIPKDICLMDTVTLQVAPSSLDNAQQFNWTTQGGNLINGYTGNYYVAWNSTGKKIISLTVAYSQCVHSPVFDTVTVHALPNVNPRALSSTDICIGDSVEFKADSGTGLTYKWYPTQYFRNASTASNKAWGKIQASGNVYVTVRDNYGCIGRDSINVTTKPCCVVSLPSAFTPNGDGLNDVFRPITKGHHQLVIFRVVNRYGQTVFESNDEKLGWDGKYAGVPQNIDTYFYYLHYICNGKDIEEKGDVTLVR